MVSRLSLALAAAAGLCVLITASSVAAKPPGSRKVVVGWIDALAMNGPNVAYSADNWKTFCRNVVDWNVLTAAAALVSGPKSGTCGDDEASGQRVTQIALAGKQVAWIRNISGNTESDDYLFAASLPSPHGKRLAMATRTGDPPLKGNWIGGLVGSGNLLAVNTWTTDGTGAVTQGRLSTISSSKLKTVATGVGSVLAGAADLGRVAVRHPDGSVTLYSAAGKPLLSITPSSTREIALRKDYLVALTQTKTLEIYNSNTGAFVRKWAVPGGARDLDVYGGIAVYAVGRKLHALQLTTGKDAVIASLKRAVVAAQIESPGVVYAYNTISGIKDFGNLVFVPMKQVAAAVS